MTTMSSREFDRDVFAAMRAASDGPVTITEKGRRSYVLLTAEQFDGLTESQTLMGDRLALNEDDVDLELPARTGSSSRGGASQFVYYCRPPSGG
jgi:prevent-host-death family protein